MTKLFAVGDRVRLIGKYDSLEVSVNDVENLGTIEELEPTGGSSDCLVLFDVRRSPLHDGHCNDVAPDKRQRYYFLKFKCLERIEDIKEVEGDKNFGVSLCFMCSLSPSMIEGICLSCARQLIQKEKLRLSMLRDNSVV